MKGVRKLFLTLVLVTAQVLLAGWIVEFDFRPYERDDRLAYASRHETGYAPSTLILNDHGDRITKKKPAGEYRILALGDSCTSSITEPRRSFCAVLSRLAAKGIPVLLLLSPRHV
jgi:hypothetical protein